MWTCDECGVDLTRNYRRCILCIARAMDRQGRQPGTMTREQFDSELAKVNQLWRDAGADDQKIELPPAPDTWRVAR